MRCRVCGLAYSHNRWNTRPIEDALRAELEQVADVARRDGLQAIAQYAENQKLRAEIAAARTQEAVMQNSIASIKQSREAYLQRCDKLETELSTAREMISLRDEVLASTKAELFDAWKRIAEIETKPTPCQWKYLGQEDGEWRATCGLSWWFENGGVKDNEIHFCPNCGHPVEEMPIESEEEN